MRHKHTVAKSSVSCHHQTGLTKKRLGGHGKEVHKQKQVNMHACTLSTKKKLVWGGRKPFTLAINIPLRSRYTMEFKYFRLRGPNISDPGVS